MATRISGGLLVLVAAAAGGIALWYRQAYNVWPGQGASARVHWCGRDYEYFGPPQTRRQISSQQRAPLHPAGRYPPLGWSGQELFAPASPSAQRAATGPPLPCAVVVYLRVGPDRYRVYSLEGGP